MSNKSRTIRPNKSTAAGKAVESVESLDPDCVEEKWEVDIKPVIGVAVADSVPNGDEAHAAEVALTPILAPGSTGKTMTNYVLTEDGGDKSFLEVSKEAISAIATNLGIPVPEFVAVNIPITRALSGFASNQLHIDSLTPMQTDGLQILYTALHEGHFRTKNKRHIDRPIHAIMWFLEQLADQYFEATSSAAPS